MLGLSGAIGVAVGAASLMAPVWFHGTSGIHLDPQVELLNERGAPEGRSWPLGPSFLREHSWQSLTRTSAIVATVVYVSYGLSRALAMGMDGRPSGTLILVMVLELGIGALTAFAMSKVPAERQTLEARRARRPGFLRFSQSRF